MGRKDHGGNRPPHGTRRFRHPGRYGAVLAGLSLGVGAERPEDDTASLSEPLHGREGWRATFPDHTKSPNEVKEMGEHG